VSLWTRRMGKRRQLCPQCGVAEADRLCDGVIRGRTPWALCMRPLCGSCCVRHGKSEFCRQCAVVRGYVSREPGDDDR
jgi:hypothetical protein